MEASLIGKPGDDDGATVTPERNPFLQNEANLIGENQGLGN
jgi:hypothetical protein